MSPPLLDERGEALLDETGGGLSAEGADDPTDDPSYWRGAAWVGHPLANWPTDGALR